MAQGENVVKIGDYLPGALSAIQGRTPAADSKELPTGTSLLHGQYTLTGFLNSGGFGISYRAIDSLGRDVVIKECFPEAICVRSGRDVRVRKPAYARDLASVVGQFMAEARSVARLKHKGIVEAHQVFMENETAYFAMDFIDGPDLLTLIEDGRHKLTPREVETISRRLMFAIGYVHERGLLHRDISPDNVLVARGLEPKLIDFGAVRRNDIADGETPWQLKFVKDGYSPDEFYDPSRSHGVESDIYSLGATLHHLVAGAAPVDAETRRHAIEKGQGDPYVLLTGRFRGYSPGFLTAIDKALSFAPEGRHASIDDWIGSIRRVSKPRVRETAPPNLYEARTEAPAALADEAEPRDVMPWIGAIAAAIGVALALLGSPDATENATAAREGPIASMPAPSADAGFAVPPEFSAVRVFEAPALPQRSSNAGLPAFRLTPPDVPVGAMAALDMQLGLADENVSVSPEPRVAPMLPPVGLTASMADLAFSADTAADR